MTQNHYNCILPEQCRKCGAIFDLWYEFIDTKQESEEIRERLGKRLSEYLCWGCKKEVFDNLSNKDKIEKESSNESYSDDEIFLDFNIE